MYREVRRLLKKALREPDPYRAVELFLAARLLNALLDSHLRVYKKEMAVLQLELHKIREIIQNLLKNSSK